MTPQEGDRLCQDLLGVLLRMASGMGVVQLEECLGCGTLADPDQPCPKCAATALRAKALRERRAA